jgi:hypothetical protein
MDTGQPVSCSEGSNGVPVRWVPEFFIPAGTVAGQANEYVVKPLQMEQRMRQSVGGCTGLTTTSYALPVISDWTDPAIGAEPTVTSAPAVIGGVVQ